jgi:hypothetical protein
MFFCYKWGEKKKGKRKNIQMKAGVWRGCDGGVMGA